MTVPEAPRRADTGKKPASIRSQVVQAGQRAKSAAWGLAASEHADQERALLLMAEALVDERRAVLEANAEDLAMPSARASRRHCWTGSRSPLPASPPWPMASVRSPLCATRSAARSWA